MKFAVNYPNATILFYTRLDFLWDRIRWRFPAGTSNYTLYAGISLVFFAQFPTIS